MNIPESTKQKLRTLIVEGKKLEAIKYVKEEFGLPLKRAARLVEVLQKETSAGNKTQPFGKGNISQPDNLFSLLSTIFLGIAILLLAMGAAIAYDTNQELNHALQLKGKVVGFEHKTGDTSIPIAEFTQNGKVRRVTGRVGSTPPDYSIGEEVTIYVINEGSEKIRISGILELWVWPLVLAFVGTVFLFIGGGMYLFIRKR